MGGEAERARFLAQVKKACRIGRKLRDLKVRQYGVDPHRFRRERRGLGERSRGEYHAASPRLSARPARIAEDFGERLAAEGEICWGGMHSWRRNVELLEMVDRPQTLGFQADMAHTMLFTMGYNAPEDRLLPEDFDWSGARTRRGLPQRWPDALRPWTIDFHVAQNDGTRERLGLARQDRPPLPALRSERQAGYRARCRRLDARRRRRADPRLPAHLLGRLHVPQRGDARSENVERRAAA